MTVLLKKAIEQAESRPDSEQDAIASRILEEMLSEQQWQEMFARDPDLLCRLADAASAEPAVEMGIDAL